jgi:ABC-2 type transport system ATP-binding protein
LIEVKNLTKKYGDHTAVKNISFTVENGKIYGFLGPNGAGKSTTMNIITGCLAATEGEVTINGLDIFEDAEEAKKFIGYLPEQPPLYLDMTPYEYLRFVAGAKGVPKAEIDDQIDEVMEVTQIAHMQDRIIKNLSKGYKQRVGIAQAMLGSPEVIILDEPTVGLDPKQIKEIRSLIHSLGNKATVILSSHILSEISAVCDHVIIISNGEVVANDTIENLSTNYTGKNLLKLIIKGADGKIRMALNDIAEIIDYNLYQDGADADIYNADITLDLDVDIREKLFYAFSKINCPILSMWTETMALEDVFLQLTEQDIAADETETEEDTDTEEDDEISDEEDEEDDTEAETTDDADYKPLFGANATNKKGDDE